MRKRDKLVAIDVGTSKVCTLVAEVDEVGGIQVIGVGITPSSGLHKAMVVNIGDAREAIRESVKKAELTSNYKIESAFVGVTGRHISSVNNRGVAVINRNDRMVRSDDLRRVLQAAQSVKVAADRKLLHVIPRDYVVDGQSGVKNPVGMHGFRLDVETHLITAAVTSVQNLVKCVNGVGVDVEDLILEPLASSEAVLTEDEKQAGVILADIGAGTTDIAVFRDGSIWHTSVLPVAGYQLTRDISIGLGVPFEVAEQMKKKYGSALPVHEGKMESRSAISVDGHGASYQDLCDIVRTRVDEMLRLILLELPREDYFKMVPAGLVLTGGSSNLPGLATLGHEILRIPVRVGAPTGVYGIIDELRDPAYATSVGLLLWAVRHRETQTWQPRGLATRLRRLAFWMMKLFR